MQQRLLGYDQAPLAEFYFFLLPVTLAFVRARSSPSFLIVAAVFLALGWCYVEMMTGEWLEAWKARVHNP